jgi:putative membrane protein
MERKTNLNNTILPAVLFIAYILGLVGYSLFEVYDPVMRFVGPASLLGITLLVLYPEIRAGNMKFLMWFGFAFAFGLLMEIIGVNSGLIFGSYTYGSALGPKIFEAPIVIGLNWGVVVAGAIQLSQIISSRKIFTIFVAPLFAVSFDILLEIMAGKLDYWHWENDIVPFQNYLAWYGISFVLSLLFVNMDRKFNSLLPVYNLISQIIFFSALMLMFS